MLFRSLAASGSPGCMALAISTRSLKGGYPVETLLGYPIPTRVEVQALLWFGKLFHASLPPRGGV